MTIQRKLQAIGILENEFLKIDSKTLQLKLADRLRKSAVAYLRKGEGSVAAGFRKEYQAVAGVGDEKEIANESSFDIYLKNQERPGVLGTYLEATALGELLDCHVVVTPVKNKHEQDPLCLHQATSEYAPIIHLYCANNSHWYSVKNKPKDTLEDGNCLYNAFAQELKKIVDREKKQIRLFLKDYYSDPVQSQQRLFDVIQKRPSWEDWLENLNSHLNRECLLSAKEKQQLRKSYQAAWQLAKAYQAKEKAQPDEYLMLM